METVIFSKAAAAMLVFASQWEEREQKGTLFHDSKTHTWQGHSLTCVLSPPTEEAGIVILVPPLSARVSPRDADCGPVLVFPPQTIDVAGLDLLSQPHLHQRPTFVVAVDDLSGAVVTQGDLLSTTGALGHPTARYQQRHFTSRISCHVCCIFYERWLLLLLLLLLLL